MMKPRDDTTWMIPLIPRWTLTCAGVWALAQLEIQRRGAGPDVGKAFHPPWGVSFGHFAIFLDLLMEFKPNDHVVDATRS